MTARLSTEIYHGAMVGFSGWVGGHPFFFFHFVALVETSLLLYGISYYTIFLLFPSIHYPQRYEAEIKRAFQSGVY
jgi:hypothetical protein